VNGIFDIQEGVGTIPGIAQRLFSISYSARELLGDTSQWFWFRNVYGGENVQIEVMDIPRGFNLVRHHDREWVGVKAILFSKGGDDLVLQRAVRHTISRKR
jgi:hypothetical protein